MASVKEILKKFKSSIRRGTGEAVLLIMNHPEIDFTDEILRACQIGSFITFLELDNRSDYLFGLIKMSQNPDKIKEAVIWGLKNETKNHTNLQHLYSIAYHFAIEGKKDVRIAMYNRFYRKKIELMDEAGFDMILKMDGLDGLKFIAARIGEFIHDYRGDSIISVAFIIEHFAKEHPKIKAIDELRLASGTNFFIAYFIKAYFIELSWKKRNEDNEKLYEENNDIYKRISEGKRLAFRDSYVLSKKELLNFADMLIKETKISLIEDILWIFTQNKFPLEAKILVDFAQKEYSQKNLVHYLALNAMSLKKSIDIRNYALTNTIPLFYQNLILDLLVLNYREGDSVFITNAIKNAANSLQIDELTASCISIYLKNKTRECKTPLIELYKKSSRSNYRFFIVKILIENNVLPDKIKNEIKYDSYEATRKLYEQYFEDKRVKTNAKHSSDAW